MSQKVHALLQLDLVAKPLQPGPQRAVPDDQDVDIVAGDRQQFRRPDHVVDPLLWPQPGDGGHQPGVGRQFPTGQQFLPRPRAGLVRWDPVGDQDKLVLGNPRLKIKFADAAAIDDDPRGPPSQGTIDGQLVPAFPRVGTLFAADHHGHPTADRRGAAVGVGGEKPGLHDVGFKPGDQLLQGAEGHWIHLEPLANDRHGNPGVA